ncbi:MAG: LysR family transcriptional regulator [Pseudomonadota bacterium]|nr:LysR family transcriptional regulator [Pseudomonadota bacterium]
MRSLMPRQLLVFQAVCDHGSFSAAAEAVGLTQPAVTKSIQALEAQLGVKLFERGASGFHETRAAKVLRRRVRWILREIELVDDELRARNEMFDGHLTIGANPVWATRFLPRILPAIYEAFPKLTLDVTVGSGESLIPLLNEGHLDMFFGLLPEPRAKSHIMQLHMFDVEVVLFARADHPIHAGAPTTLAAVWDYPWVAFSKHYELDRRIEQLATEFDLPPKRFSLTSMSIASLVTLSQQTDHIVFAVDQLGSHMEENGFAPVPIDVPLLSFSTGAMVRASIEELDPVRMFLTEIRKLD